MHERRVRRGGAPMNQFRLLRERRFAPFFGTQFLGAFNDNVFKNALVISFAFDATRAADAAFLVNLSAGLFILPFFLFSSLAGQLADRYEKSMLMRRVKLAEIGIMSLAAVGLAVDSTVFLVAVLFLYAPVVVAWRRSEELDDYGFHAQPIGRGLAFSLERLSLGGETVEGIRMERTRVEDGRSVGTGEFFDIACGLVIPAIGYYSEPFPGVPFDDAKGIVVHEDGRVGDGIYAVGWIKRGPTGVIGSNKPDGETAATQILEDISGGSKPGHEALAALLADRNVRVVDYSDWKKIDAAEASSARSGAPRRKFVTIDDMVKALD